MLMLAPRSHKVFSNIWLPIEQSIVGHPGSFFLVGEECRIASLHASVSLMTSVEGSGPLLLRMTQMYFAYVGTYIASNNKMLTYNFWMISTNIPNRSSVVILLLLCGKGRRVVSWKSCVNSGSCGSSVGESASTYFSLLCSLASLSTYTGCEGLRPPSG